MLAICCYKKRKYSPKWGQVTTDIRGEIWRDKNLCNKMLHTAHTHTDRHTHDPASHFIICRVCVGARLHIQNGCKDERRLMRKKEGKKVGQECRRKQGKEKDKRGCLPLPRCLSQSFFFSTSLAVLRESFWHATAVQRSTHARYFHWVHSRVAQVNFGPHLGSRQQVWDARCHANTEAHSPSSLIGRQHPSVCLYLVTGSSVKR